MNLVRMILVSSQLSLLEVDSNFFGCCLVKLNYFCFGNGLEIEEG